MTKDMKKLILIIVLSLFVAVGLSKAQGVSTGVSVDYTCFRIKMTSPDFPGIVEIHPIGLPSITGYMDYMLSNKWSIASSLNAGYYNDTKDNLTSSVLAELFGGPQFTLPIFEKMRFDIAAGPSVLYVKDVLSKEDGLAWGAQAKIRIAYYITESNFLFWGINGSYLVRNLSFTRWDYVDGETYEVREYQLSEKHEYTGIGVSLGFIHSF